MSCALSPNYLIVFYNTAQHVWYSPSILLVLIEELQREVELIMTPCMITKGQ